MSNKSVEERLKELDFELPVVAKPVAEYVPAKLEARFHWMRRTKPQRSAR